MPWIQLHLPATPADASRLEAALEQQQALAITLTDGADEPLFEPPPGSTPLWQQTVVSALFEADINVEALLTELQHTTGLALSEFQQQQIDDKAWERAWMDDFKPLCFGKRLWVIPSNHEAPNPTAINLKLDPGLAFGTGTHDTTALCLNWIDHYDFDDKQVLDFGCGSGILAIAALLCGAKSAIGTDIDPQALLASDDNAHTNQVANRLSLYLPEALPQQPADILFANILAAPLIELAPQLAALTKANGKLVLSGILQSQADDVSASYQAWFDMQPAVVQGDWVRLDGTRKA